ncbi:MAG: CDP-alcohol phosphatidyltransferase family protein [Polyangiaceae bacterium]|nr:CDP-alcohol phosphatidyltransferase family protein [Polyangiaceae bacterium]
MHSNPLGESRPLVGIVIALPVPGADPLDELAGLPLALRTVLTLQKEGVARAVLLVPEGRSDVAARLQSDRRVKIPTEIFPCRTAAAGLRDARDLLSAPFLIARAEAVVDPAVYRALKAHGIGSSAAVLATKNGEPVGPLLSTSALVDALGDADLDPTLDRLTREGAIRSMDIGAAWAERATTPEGRRRAFNALFEACRKPVDGIVARHINRHISIFISKRIVNTSITPNMMSVLTFLLGIAGAVSVAFGGYFPFLLGAFLFQWNSILDGVDGELARVRFQHSTLGQWLDTVSDDASNLLFFVGLILGSAAFTVPLPSGPFPLGRYLGMLGWAGVAAFILATVQYYIEMISRGTGDLYAIDWEFDKKPPEGLAGKLLVFWRYVLKKDFANLFFLGLAAVGVLPLALFFIGGGAIGTFIAATLRNIKKRRGAALSPSG